MMLNPSAIDSKRIKYIWLLLVVLGVVLLFTPLRLISYLILLIGIAALLPLPKSFGIILRTTLTFLFVTCLQQVIGLVFWKMNVSYTYIWALLPFYILLSLGLLQTKFTYSYSFDFKRREIVSLAVGLLSAGIIAFTTLSGGPHFGQLMRFVTRGFDSSTHLSLVMSLYDNQGYLYGPVDQVGEKLVFNTLSAYPEGWHLTTAIMWHGISNNLSMEHTSRLLAVYFATALLWYAIMLFLFTNFALLIAERLLKSSLSWLEYGAVISIAILVQLACFLGVMRYGFVNYIAIIAYLLALSTLLLGLYVGLVRKRAYLLMGSLLAAGVTLTWLLAAPIGYLMLLAPLLLSTRILPLKNLLVVVRNNAFTIVAAGIILASGFVQLLLQMKYSTIPNNINAGTGIWVTNYLVYSLLFTIFVAVLLAGKVKGSIIRAISVPVLSTGLLLGGIYLFQYQTAAKIGYYSDKLNVLLLVFLTAFLAALFTVAARRLRKLYGPALTVAFLVTITVAAPVVLGINTSESRFALGTDRKLSPYTASQLSDIVANGQAFQNNVVIMKQLDYEEDVITTHFFNVLSKEENACSSEISWAQMTADEDKTVSTIIRCAEQQKPQTFYVVASSKDYSKLSERFSSSDNIQLILSN